MAIALADDRHVVEQKARYGARRAQLLEAVEGTGLRIDESRAGLYLWATRDEDCWATLATFAELGILVTPGEFYGEAGRRHVRISLTATDERVAAAASRLAASSK
jgi:aspartate/methionine/tyrosine aminotransferase